MARTDLILVVDDESQIQRLLQRSLAQLGYSVVQALTGQQGLNMAEDARPALILLDLRMPGMDGHTFLRRLHTKAVDASVIVMSGAAEMEDVVEVVRLGATDFLKKPWTPEELAAALGRATTTGQLRPRTVTATPRAPMQPRPNTPPPSVSAALPRPLRAPFQVACPRCAGRLVRAPRRPIDRLLSLVKPVWRYRCELCDLSRLQPAEVVIADSSTPSPAQLGALPQAPK